MAFAPFLKRRRLDLLLAAAIAFSAAVCAVLPDIGVLQGLSIDALTSLRWNLFGASRPAGQSPTVVIALDEETYNTPPFSGTPSVTWTGEIGRLLTAVLEANASVVGFDLIFPVSIEESEMQFGDETLGSRTRGFDRDFLRALAAASSANKIVLGEVQHQEHPILPSPGQRVAVRQLQNIRPLNVYTDADGVVRRMPLSFSVDGAIVPSMAVELAARAEGTRPQFLANGSVKLGGYAVPTTVPNTMTLNFEGGAEDIPTYSLADLRACIEKGDREFFRRHFAGKVVLLGTVLDSEDRKLSSKRFATAPEGARVRCASSVPVRRGGGFARDSISGVYLHATAVNNLIEQEVPVELATGSRIAIATAIAFLMAVAALTCGPLWAALLCVTLSAAWTMGATYAFRSALVLPLAEPLIAGAIALGAMVAYRFIISDKDRRLLRQSFGLYLGPAVVDKLTASNKPPVLGGELRTISIFFSDIAGFSSIAESLSPRDLVGLTNAYFREMTDTIEAHDGFVDKYIGDGIVAMFGAPLDSADHGVKAVRAALACQARLATLRKEGGAFSRHWLGTRIGVNSGEVLVGNIGSYRHLSYTAMGDAVNVAAWLEEANRHFGCTVLASETTMTLTRTKFLWREIDLVQLKGRDAPLRVFEPLAIAEERSEEIEKRITHYAAGLACWRARDFAGSAREFGLIADCDVSAALFRARAEHLAAQPPGADWQAITTLQKGLF